MLPPRKNTRSRGWAFVRLILTIVFFLAAAWLWLNQQYVLDQVAYWNYQPTAEVTNLADRAGMSDEGRFLYYASHPLIDGTQKFNQECGSTEQSTAILGCYTNNSIYIYDVTDPRLDGIREVTAAHEMLHAAYQRMSDAEKTQVNQLLEVEYTKLVSDPQFKDRMAFYARTEPGERDNELHSIIGTEVGSVSPELEAHYKKYFTDRSKVVALNTQYSSVFKQLQDQATQLYSQLDTLNKKIQANSDTYNADVLTLNKDIQTFNTRASSGGFSSEAQFDSERAVLVSRANELSNQRTAINQDIATYETLRTQYNDTASESKQLDDSINSKLAPAPSI